MKKSIHRRRPSTLQAEASQQDSGAGLVEALLAKEARVTQQAVPVHGIVIGTIIDFLPSGKA